MTQEQKITLVDYLYLNKETQSFLCNDLFQELKHTIPETLCISEKNINDEIRINNYSCVKMLILIFFQKNPDYKDITKKLFANFTEKKLIEHLILGYVFFLTIIDKNNIDIFKDKKSICYTKAPALYDIII